MKSNSVRSSSSRALGGLDSEWRGRGPPHSQDVHVVSTAMEVYRERDFLPDELQLFAEDTSVTVIPNFSLPSTSESTLECLVGKFGPFQPNSAVEVPLWLALALRKRGRCHIQMPSWLQADKLQKVAEDERNTGGEAFQALPDHYIEMAQLLLKHKGEDDRGDTYKIRQAVEAVRLVRSTKLDSGLKGIDMGVSLATLTNLSTMEINSMRLFVQRSMDRFRRLGQMGAQSLDASQLTAATQEQNLRRLRR